ncbi:hypothetical protein B0H11DRAFT_2375654 [Mycena galericulata]|nr:hypothetical protein B0H11DRAFT_2375654 [Mycena galericulata]
MCRGREAPVVSLAATAKSVGLTLKPFSATYLFVLHSTHKDLHENLVAHYAPHTAWLRALAAHVLRTRIRASRCRRGSWTCSATCYGAAGVGGPVAELAKGFSWVLVKWKSHSDGAQHGGVTLVLYEEFVPRKYRLAFAGAAPSGTKRRLPSLFWHAALSGAKVWKREPTLYGCP